MLTVGQDEGLPLYNITIELEADVILNGSESSVDLIMHVHLASIQNPGFILMYVSTGNTQLQLSDIVVRRVLAKWTIWSGDGCVGFG